MMIQRVTTLPQLPSRPDDANKGTFGKVLIVAGSSGMSGAAALSGTAALRGGAGLVYVATAASMASIVASMEPCYLTHPLPDNRDGELKSSAIGIIEELLPRMTAAAIGPGLGSSSNTLKLVRKVYRDTELPLVVDADGLNALASAAPEKLSQHAGPRILTPHPGEFARLIRSEIPHVQAHREELAIEFAARHNIVLVLKGQGTVVTDGHQLYVNTTGNSGMATGGTGDVLTGLVAALLAQKLNPFSAAQLGVYLHGLAGDLAAAELSKPGMIASDLLRYLPAAWRAFL